MAKARQFLAVADDVRDLYESDDDVADACVTLYVHAGIAAGDAICARHIAVIAQGQSHHESVLLLKTVDASAAQSLATLIGMKSRAGYGYDPVTIHQLKRANRAAHSLVNRAAT